MGCYQRNAALYCRQSSDKIRETDRWTGWWDLCWQPSSCSLFRGIVSSTSQDCIFRLSWLGNVSELFRVACDDSKDCCSMDWMHYFLTDMCKLMQYSSGAFVSPQVKWKCPCTTKALQEGSRSTQDSSVLVALRTHDACCSNVSGCWRKGSKWDFPCLRDVEILGFGYWPLS